MHSCSYLFILRNKRTRLTRTPNYRTKVVQIQQNRLPILTLYSLYVMTSLPTYDVIGTSEISLPYPAMPRQSRKKQSRGKKTEKPGAGGGRDGGVVVEHWTLDPEVQRSNPWGTRGRIPGAPQGSNPRGTGPWWLAATPWHRKKSGTCTGMATGWDEWATSRRLFYFLTLHSYRVGRVGHVPPNILTF